eukprot:g22229.t1
MEYNVEKYEFIHREWPGKMREYERFRGDLIEVYKVMKGMDRVNGKTRRHCFKKEVNFSIFAVKTQILKKSHSGLEMFTLLLSPGCSQTCPVSPADNK